MNPLFRAAVRGAVPGAPARIEHRAGWRRAPPGRTPGCRTDHRGGCAVARSQGHNRKPNAPGTPSRFGTQPRIALGTRSGAATPNRASPATVPAPRRRPTRASRSTTFDRRPPNGSMPMRRRIARFWSAACPECTHGPSGPVNCADLCHYPSRASTSARSLRRPAARLFRRNSARPMNGRSCDPQRDISCPAHASSHVTPLMALMT